MTPQPNLQRNLFFQNEKTQKQKWQYNKDISDLSPNKF